jgi:hypothetical protein
MVTGGLSLTLSHSLVLSLFGGTRKRKGEGGDAGKERKKREGERRK